MQKAYNVIYYYYYYQQDGGLNVSKLNTVYILLSHSGSMFSRAINVYTRDPYTHVSIGFDADLDELYSFGRLRPYNPIWAGFVKEDVINGTYGRFPKTKCALYSLEIDDIQYKKLVNEVNRFKTDGNKYGYNFIGLFGAMFNYPIERKYYYFCSQFVSEILHKSGINIVDKDPGLTSPMDFRECKELSFVYEGYLSTYSLEKRKLATMQL